MSRVFLAFFILTLLLSGCDKLDNIQFVKPPLQKEDVVLTNTTEENNTEDVVNNKLSICDNCSNIIVASTTSILIVDDGMYDIVDSSKEDYKLIKFINELGLNQTNNMIVTSDTSRHSSGIPNLVVRAPPTNLFDNGQNSKHRDEYIERLDKYNRYWEREETEFFTILNDFKKDKFELFVPYSKGLSTNKEENSVVVRYFGEFLYMSDCRGGCEQRIPPLTATFIILANDGNCNTTSFDFIISTGAKYVIGESICPELKEEMDLIGINYIEMSKEGAIHIILGGGKHELRKGY